MTNEPEVYCMSITPFREDGSFDADAYRAHLDRMVAANMSVYFASPGSGEGHTLSLEELAEIYRVGVECCKGRVATRANLPEARNLPELLRTARIAQDAGVDVIQIYTVDPGHGTMPTEAEQEAFYRGALDAIDHPVGLSVNILAGGYVTPIGLLKRLCDDYAQVVSINVLQPPTSYFAELVDTIGPRAEYYCGVEMLAEGLLLGARGCLTGHANVVPYLIRAIGCHHAAGRLDESGKALMDLFRLSAAVSRFSRSIDSPQWLLRWLKPAMKVLDLPGHSDGRMRHPYLGMTAEQMEKLGETLRRVDVAGMESRARSAF